MPVSRRYAMLVVAASLHVRLWSRVCVSRSLNAGQMRHLVRKKSVAGCTMQVVTVSGACQAVVACVSRSLNAGQMWHL